MIDKVKILGIDILAAEDQQSLLNYLISPNEVKCGKLIAINAEKAVKAKSDTELGALLETAEFKYADGISIVKSIMKKYPRINNLERIAGCDLWHGLMQKAGEFNIPVFLIGSHPDVLSAVVNNVKAQWNVNIVGYQDGYFNEQEEDNLIEKIKNSGAKIVPIAMGSPKQEKFMLACQKKYPEALYMGVGGTYDVFVGKIKRAPLLWQKFNLEWLYRLLKQPTRWKRQLSLIKYAYYYATNKL